MRGSRAVVAAIVVLLFLPLAPGDGAPGLGAQEAEAAQEGALNVFLDCQPQFICDFDHFRRVIPFVNWVRDREDAGVHLLVTYEATGAGGRDYTLAFIGRDAFQGRDSELSYVSNTTDTRDEIREGLARTIRLGLMPYVVDTPAAERIRIEYQAPEGEEEAAATPADDPWDFWVFTVGVSGFFRGESLFSSESVSPSLSARRITEDWKFSISTSGNWSDQTFQYADGSEDSFFSRRVSANWLLARSMGPHWTVGARGDVRTDTRLNTDLAYSVRPGVEYNLFPYSESTRRQLTLLYSAGVRHFTWDEVTIFDETEEIRWDESLTLSLDLTQPWGSATLSIEGSHYFHDFQKNQVSVFGNLNFRLFRGLSLDLFGSYSRIRDQLFLPARDLSDEEILLRLRALETDFTYVVSIGLRYTFGSIYNNVVNPRYDGSSGAFFFF